MKKILQSRDPSIRQTVYVIGTILGILVIGILIRTPTPVFLAVFASIFVGWCFAKSRMVDYDILHQKLKDLQRQLAKAQDEGYWRGLEEDLKIKDNRIKQLQEQLDADERRMTEQRKRITDLHNMRDQQDEQNAEAKQLLIAIASVITVIPGDPDEKYLLPREHAESLRTITQENL